MADSACVGPVGVPCPKCDSKSGWKSYEDGSKYCHACENKEHGEQDADIEYSATLEGVSFIDVTVGALQARGLTEFTCRKWGYGVGRDHEGNWLHIEKHCDVTGRQISQKMRTKEKDFFWINQPKKPLLYGQWLWRSGGRMLVICEGALDTLSVSQMQLNK